MNRRSAVTLSRLLLCGALTFSAWSGSTTSVPADQIDQIYTNWERALAEHAANPQPPPEPIVEPVPIPVPNGETAFGAARTRPVGRSIVSDRRFPVSAEPAAAPEPAPEAATEEEVLAATDDLSASTETAAPVLPTPTPTPGLVKIKVAKVVEGKIIEVEVLVTPTPGPAAATDTAQADVQQVTGERAALQQKLKMAATASKKKIVFTRSELRKLLTDFQNARSKNPNFDTILPRSKAMQVQAALQRSSSLAQGGELPPATARSLLTLLFPPPKPKAPPPAEAPLEASPGEAVYSEDTYYVEEGAEAGQPEIYIDPETGQEVYWDGSPVYSEDGAVQPPPEEYYEEAPPEGEEYYYEEGTEEEYAPEGTYEEGGEVYYEDDGGEVYYEEEPAEE